MRALFLLIVVVAALTGASYAAAKFTAGKVVGADHRLGRSTTRFAFVGIQSLRNHPRGWIVAYPSARDMAPGGAEIYVSPTGTLLGSRPGDLSRRMDDARRRRDEP